jgi:hypothetical protein
MMEFVGAYKVPDGAQTIHFIPKIGPRVAAQKPDAALSRYGLT